MEKMAHLIFGKTSKILRLRFINPLIVSLILILASFLRLYKISDYMTFLGDEGRDVLIVREILSGNFTLLGPTASVGGFFLGPIYYYFMAPFLWLFNYDPVGPAVMVALFGVATVWLVYKVGSEFFDEKTGLFAAVLYSIPPLVIAYSRSSWNPNLMPFFTLLTLFTLYKAVTRSDLKLFLLSGLLFGITMQLHYLATFLGVIITLYVLLLKEVLKILKAYSFFLLGFLIGWSPFLLFEVRHDFPNLQSILNFILHSDKVGSNTQFFVILGDVFFRLFGRLMTAFPPPEQVSVQAHLNIALWYFATLALALLAVSIFLFQFLKSFKKRNENFQKFSLLFLWFFIGMILFGFYKKPIYDYYFGFMFALPFLLVGNALSFLLKQGRLLKIASIVIFVFLLIINLRGIPFRFAPNKQKDQVKKISEFVLSETDRKPFNFALITLGNSDHAYRYFMKLENRDPVEIQNSQIDPQRKSVTDQLLIICEDQRCQPLGNSLWEVAGFGRAEIANEWDLTLVKVYKLIHYKGS